LIFRNSLRLEFCFPGRQIRLRRKSQKRRQLLIGKKMLQMKQPTTARKHSLVCASLAFAVLG